MGQTKRDVPERQILSPIIGLHNENDIRPMQSGIEMRDQLIDPCPGRYAARLRTARLAI